MARWRLDEPHYLPVPGTEWEHSEISREGKSLRQRFAVPQYLDPRDPGDFNYPGEGIIVAYDNKRFPRDIVFTGEPTPAMTPLDDEAEALTESLRHKWKHPIDTLPSDFSQSLLHGFEQQITKLLQRDPSAGQPQPTPVTGVSVEQFEALQQQVAALMQRNAELEAATPERRA